MSPVIEVSREELLTRRDEILGRLRVDLSEYRQHAREHRLTSDEWAVRDELDGLLFLLGEESLAI